jgi:Toprim domain
VIDLRTRQGFDDIKRILDDRPEDVLAMCAIKIAKQRGSTLVIDDPRGQGHGNFAIWLKRDGLSWKNYTTDEKGRSLELIAYCKGWYHLDRRGAKEAARFAVDQLGLGRVSEEDLARDRAQAAAKQATARTEAARDLARKRKAAFMTFINAQGVLGTPAEIYLREIRGLDLQAAPFIGPRGGNIAPKCLRFLPSHKYIRRDKNGTKLSESFHPCLIACCVDKDMQIVALHQTFLRDDGMGKAEIKPAPDGAEQPTRKVWPESACCVIPLWNGAEQLTVRQARENFEQHGVVETIVLTEGIEDGLSAVVAAPKHRTWAMISLSNMSNVAERIPGFVDSIMVHRQNDWDKPQAVEQFDRGFRDLQRGGRIVVEIEAVQGKNLNDTHRGVGAVRTARR